MDAGIGTENYYRATVDGNYNLTDRFAVRVNGVYHNADTPGRDYVEAERYGATAAASWEATDTLMLSADYYHFRLKGIPDFGHPFDVATQQPYKVDRDNFYGIIGRDFLSNSADIATFRLDFDPIDDLSFRSVTRYGRTTNRYIVGTPGAVCRVARTATGACPAGGTSSPPTGTGVPVAESGFTTTAGGQRRWGTNRYLANVTDVTAQINSGGIEQTIVFGGEYARERVSTLPLAIPAFIEDSSGNVVSTPTTFVRNLLNPDPVLGYTIDVQPGPHQWPDPGSGGIAFRLPDRHGQVHAATLGDAGWPV